MDQQQQARWQLTRRLVLWAVGIAAFLTVSVLIGYRYGITLWDWIKLLIVPTAIAGAGLWFNTQQREREQRIADNRAQDDSLQAYLDEMSQLLTDKDLPLHSAQPGDSVSTVARARTLTVLGRLGSGRKRSVLQFLYDAGLIYKEQTLLNESDLIERRHYIVSLQQADLSGAYLTLANLSRADLREADLREANLSGAYLSGAYLGPSKAYYSHANLSGANLFRATLNGANLFRATLSAANLRKAYLPEANLQEANLQEANLQEANLQGARLTIFANLSRADLERAKDITNEQLEQAKTLEGAIMPDGSKHS